MDLEFPDLEKILHSHHKETKRYRFGELIDLQSNTLGLVKDGVAEIYDEGRVRLNRDHPTACRPIRTLRRGDLLGEFSILDDVINAIQSPAAETWKVCAGRRSFLLMEKVENRNRFLLRDRDHDDQIDIHHFINPILSEQCTTIEVYNASTIVDDSVLLNHLFRVGWKHAKLYRDGHNSFNDRERRILHGQAVATFLDAKGSFLAGLTAREMKKPDVKKAALFIDAVFDVFDRPLRQECMFGYDPNFVDSIAARMKKQLQVDPQNLLIARLFDRDVQELWFPIDMGNLIISSVGGEVYRANLNPVQERASGEKSATVFLEELASELVKFYQSRHRNYPYAVSSVRKPGPTALHLLLHFKKKAHVVTDSGSAGSGVQPGSPVSRKRAK